MLADVGFGAIECFGDLEGGELTREDETGWLVSGRVSSAAEQSRRSDSS